MLQLGGLLPKLTPLTRSPGPYYCIGNESKVFYATTTWHNYPSDLEPFDYQADALAI